MTTGGQRVLVVGQRTHEAIINCLSAQAGDPTEPGRYREWYIESLAEVEGQRNSDGFAVVGGQWVKVTSCGHLCPDMMCRNHSDAEWGGEAWCPSCVPVFRVNSAGTEAVGD